MTFDIVSLLIGSKGNNVMKIMRYVKETPKTPAQISNVTQIPIAMTYRLLAQLEEIQCLKSIADTKGKIGRTTQKYYRGKKYQITITPDEVKIRIFRLKVLKKKQIKIKNST